MEDLGTGNLVWPGKIMGLAPYGEVVDEWLPHFIEFYKSDPDGANDEYVEKINKLGESIGIIFDSNNRLFGQNEYNVAATSQRAFEECFLEVAEPYITKHPDTPICVVGGCALNIILNTKIKNMFNREVFVGPNPNDCGIAVGNLLKHLKPKHPIDLTYAGVPILDEDMLPQHLSNHNFIYGGFKLKKIMPFDPNYHFIEQIEFDEIIEHIINGKIIGVNDIRIAVVGRVDVDAFDLFAVGVEEELEGF